MNTYNYIVVSDYKGGELSDWVFDINLEEALAYFWSDISESIEYDSFENREILSLKSFSKEVAEKLEGYAGYSGCRIYIIDKEKGEYTLKKEDYITLYDQYTESMEKSFEEEKIVDYECGN